MTFLLSLVVASTRAHFQIPPNFSVTTIRHYRAGESERFKVVASAAGYGRETLYVTTRVLKIYPNGDADLSQKSTASRTTTYRVFQDGFPEIRPCKVDKFGVSYERIQFDQTSWTHVAAVLPRAINLTPNLQLKVLKDAELKGRSYWQTKIKILKVSGDLVTFQAEGVHQDGSGYPPGDSKVHALAVWNMTKHWYQSITIDETYVYYSHIANKLLATRVVYTRI